MAGAPRPDDGRSAPTVAIALGANLGDPAATLVAVRPRLEDLVAGWWGRARAERRCRWSPLFLTAPVGGPPGQPPYRNAVLLVEGALPLPDPLPLLRGLQGLEDRHGRRRAVRWGPRTLDLDLLWCGDLRRRSAALELPHPRLLERAFVMAPLAAIEPRLVPPGAVLPAATLLARLPACSGPAPRPLPPRPGWPEGPPS